MLTKQFFLKLHSDQMAKYCSYSNCTNPSWSKDKKTGLGYCKNHQGARTDLKGKRTSFTNTRKSTGEMQVFVNIWNKRPHISFVTGEPITFFDPSNFAHVLPKRKGAYPEFMLNEENIVLLDHSKGEHGAWDNNDIGLNKSDLQFLPEWKVMFELEAELKAEYKERYG